LFVGSEGDATISALGSRSAHGLCEPLRSNPTDLRMKAAESLFLEKRQPKVLITIKLSDLWSRLVLFNVRTNQILSPVSAQFAFPPLRPVRRFVVRVPTEDGPAPIRFEAVCARRQLGAARER